MDREVYGGASPWDIMKLASTWCILDPERVCSELNELFFLKGHFMAHTVRETDDNDEYFEKALSITELNEVVYAGPN